MNKLLPAVCKTFLASFLSITTQVTGQSIPVNFYNPAVNFQTGNLAFCTSIGDIDGDGKPDMVTVNAGDNTMSVFRNTSGLGNISSSSFAPAVTFNTGISPTYVSMSDFDGDGKLDLAVANSGSNTVSVYQNTSTTGVINSNSFADKVDFLTNVGPFSLDIIDLDSDGKPEIITANINSNSVSVLKNTASMGIISSTSFSDKLDYDAGGGNPSIVKAGDLNGDNKPEIIVANYTTNSVSVLQNTSVAGSINLTSFEGRFDLLTGSTPFSIAIADFNTDGRSDFAVTNLSGSISIFQNNYIIGLLAPTSFSRVDLSTGDYSPSLNVSDVDGDGKIDLLTANQYAGTFSVIRNTNIGSNISTASFAAKVDFSVVGSPLSVATGDLTGDGISEVIISTYNANSVSVHQGKGLIECIPPLVECPPAITVQCAGAVPSPNPGSVAATNKCGGALTTTWEGDVISDYTCENKYTITRTYKVTNAFSGSSTCTQIITVNDNIAPVITCPGDIIVAPTSLSGAIVYFNKPIVNDICGQSTTVQKTGLTSGATFPIGTMKNTYEVTDACGNSSLCSFNITVTDPYCDRNMNSRKVYVCHEGKTICVSINALQMHLDHGDYLGSCISNASSNTTNASTISNEIQVSEKKETEPVINGLTIKAFPNPSTGKFNLTVKSNSSETVQLKVFDVVGREVYTANGSANATYQFGQNFSKGNYLIKVLQKDKQATLKLTKQ